MNGTQRIDLIVAIAIAILSCGPQPILLVGTPGGMLTVCLAVLVPRRVPR
jgi:hypothetical protein